MRSTGVAFAASVLSLGATMGCGGGGSGGGSASSPPAPASNLTVVSTTSSHVVLAWTDNSTDEEGFAVERSTSGGPFAEIGRVAANVTGYQDLTIAADSSYTYRVRSFGAGGEAAPSNEANTTTYTLAALQAMLGQDLEALRGDEIPPASASGTYLGVTYTVTFLGFAFCTPPDPYAAPVANPTPPDDVYGCQNVLGVTLAPSQAGDAITLTVSAPDLYFDCSTYSTVTGTDACYVAYTDAMLTASAALATTPDGRKVIQGPVVPISFTETSSAFHSQDGAVDGLGSILWPLVSASIEQQVLDFAASAVGSYLSLIPPYVP